MRNRIALLILSLFIAASVVAQTPQAVTQQPQSSATTRPATMATLVKKNGRLHARGVPEGGRPTNSRGNLLLRFLWRQKGR
jgi:hypothetical protein